MLCHDTEGRRTERRACVEGNSIGARIDNDFGDVRASRDSIDQPQQERPDSESAAVLRDDEPVDGQLTRPQAEPDGAKQLLRSGVTYDELHRLAGDGEWLPVLTERRPKEGRAGVERDGLPPPSAACAGA